MKEAQDQPETNLRSDETGKQDLIQQRAELGQKLESAQVESRALKQQVNSLAQQSTDETTDAKVLGTKVNDLTRLLQDREGSLGQQVELLSHDRDIRDLMGGHD